jgi:hypothetical protein
MKNQTLSGYSGATTGLNHNPKNPTATACRIEVRHRPDRLQPLLGVTSRARPGGKWRGETKLAELAPASGCEADAGRDFAGNPTGSLKDRSDWC